MSTLEDFDRLDGKLRLASPRDEHLEVWNRWIKLKPAEVFGIFEQELAKVRLSLTPRLSFTALGGDAAIDRERMQYVVSVVASSRTKPVASGKRIIKLTDRIAEHTVWHIAPDFRRKGIATALLRAAVRLYTALSLRGVRIHAALDEGGYFWAKLGFKPDADNWPSVKLRVGENWRSLVLEANERTKWLVTSALSSQDPSDIWIIAQLDQRLDDTTFGKHLLRSAAWHGFLDFEDASAMRLFRKQTGFEL